MPRHDADTKVWVSTETVQRARNAVAALRKRGAMFITLASFFDDAAQDRIDAYEKAFNGGQPFGEDEPLNGGRPRVVDRDD